jgi:long-chain-fatty-acid--CoA ligase ACSBG
MGNSVLVPTFAPENAQSDYLAYPPSYAPFWNSDPNGTARIQVSKTGLASSQQNPQITVCDLFALAAKKQGNKLAMRTENMKPIGKGEEIPPALPANEWKTWTYKQYYKDSRAAAKALIHLGYTKGDAINIYGFNSPEWFIGMMGGILAGGKATGIYPSDNEEQLAYKVLQSNGSIAFVETAANLNKFKAVIDDIPYLKAIVCWATPPGKPITRKDGSLVKTLSFVEFIKVGLSLPDVELEDRILAQQPGDCCALIYTSGTTGKPKAVMITHDNLVYEALSFVTSIGTIGVKAEEERIISYLPLSHVAGMMVDIITPIAVTAKKKGWVSVTFARPYDLKAGSLGARLQFTKPTIFLGVPRVWEKIQEKLKKVGAQTKGLKKKIADGAKAKSALYQAGKQMGGSGRKPKSLVFYEVFLKLIRQKLGLEKCKYALAGAAPMTMDTLSYFGSLGININEVYGMSECTGACTVSTDKHHVYGSVGYEMPGCEVKVFKVDPDDINKKEPVPLAANLFAASEAEQGELCFRGRNIMLGYMANPKLGEEHVKTIAGKNAGTIDEEGWLHSGDKGVKDVHGMIKITGRYKELIITAGGENVAPVPIEFELKKVVPAISNIIMIGNKRKFNIALITLKAVGSTGELPGGNELDSEAAEITSAKTISDAMEDKAYIDFLTKGFADVNNNGEVVPSNAARIQKFSILPRDFSVDTGELTGSMKLKRAVVEKQYAAIIEAMYDEKNVKSTYIPYKQAPNPNIPIGVTYNLNYLEEVFDDDSKDNFKLGSIVEEADDIMRDSVFMEEEQVL